VSRLALLDVPLDSSGAGRGEEHAPEALRAAGLLERLGARDAGNVQAARVRDTRRDPATGVIAAAEVRGASAAIGARVGELLEAGERPIVIGGDCTLLLGVFDALPAGSGLWCVDGHADFHDGELSPTGEAADMELSVLTGHGPDGLLAGREPPLDPAALVLLGHRPDDLAPEVAAENARLDAAIEAHTSAQVLERGPAALGAAAARRLAGRPAWLHIDLDVLDETALSAVTYPQPRGIDWQQLAALCAPFATAANLVGVSIADFNPDRDPDGAQARRVVDAVVALLGSGNAEAAQP
jgi:arginase family enzyme